jgi:hypothetical protein
MQSKARTGNTTTVKPSDQEAVQRLLAYGRYNDYLDFNIPWSVTVNYTMQMAANYDTEINRDTLAVTHNATFSGNVSVTPNWKLELYSGYNFTEKQLTLTQVNIYRDLHCWEIRLGAVPFGPNKNYNFTINVKATVLQDLKLMRRRDFRDIAN